MGFVVKFGRMANVSIDTFSARNVSIMHGVHLIGRVNHEDSGDPSIMQIRDVVLEDIIETENERFTEFFSPSRSTEGFGLIFDLLGPTELTVRNLTARNMQFGSMGDDGGIFNEKCRWFFVQV